MTSAYFMSPVRGARGDAVSAEKKASNVQKGIEIGRTIQRDFPNIDLYIPHAHEEIIDVLWRNGTPSDDIIKASCDVAITKDFGISYIGDGMSEGMKREHDAMVLHGKTIVVFAEYDEHARQKIAWVGRSVKGNE